MTAERLNPDLARKSYTPSITQGTAGTIAVQTAYEYHDFKVVNFTLTTSQAYSVGSGMRLCDVDGATNGGIVSSDGFTGVVTVAGRAWAAAAKALTSGQTVTGAMVLFK